jgi:hypothetical protein
VPHDFAGHIIVRSTESLPDHAALIKIYLNMEITGSTDRLTLGDFTGQKFRLTQRKLGLQRWAVGMMLR